VAKCILNGMAASGSGLGTGQAHPERWIRKGGYSETKVLEDVHSVCAAPGIPIHELYKL
jgi:hypothetical protein